MPLYHVKQHQVQRTGFSHIQCAWKNVSSCGQVSLTPSPGKWWSQTGSNRRPPECKSGALPAELWPRTRRRMLTSVIETPLFREEAHSIKVVGLGRLELPTSRLSSARSNQLSYKPVSDQPQGRRPHANPTRILRPQRVRTKLVREERETKTTTSRIVSRSSMF